MLIFFGYFNVIDVGERWVSSPLSGLLELLKGDDGDAIFAKFNHHCRIGGCVQTCVTLTLFWMIQLSLNWIELKLIKLRCLFILKQLNCIFDLICAFNSCNVLFPHYSTSLQFLSSFLLYNSFYLLWFVVEKWYHSLLYIFCFNLTNSILACT